MFLEIGLLGHDFVRVHNTVTLNLPQKLLDNLRKTLRGGSERLLSRNVNQKERMAMTILNNICPEAQKFVEAEGYYYSPEHLCFVKGEDGISYEEIDRMGLVDTHGWKPSSRTDAEIRRAMRWLAAKLNITRKD